MKKVILSMAVLATMAFTSCKNEAKKETKKGPTEVVNEMATTDFSFGVRGNCGMCKSTIEKAAKGVAGVTAFFEKNLFIKPTCSYIVYEFICF